MNINTLSLLYVLLAIFFLSVVSLYLIKKNTIAVRAYVFQSSAIAFILFLFSLENLTALPIIALAMTVLVKVFVAPSFFFRLIRRHELKFSASTYLNLPVTLLILAILTFLIRSFFLASGIFDPSRQNFLIIASSAIVISLFLIINRKGALSQMLGVLSLENSIVAFAAFAGLEQSPALQLGIVFDILIWVVISTIFVSMVYSHFGSLDVTKMKHLTE